MSTSTVYPNGQVLVSSAITPVNFNLLMQTLTCGMLGINPPDVSQIRIDWPTEGQPFVKSPAIDVCFLAIVPENVDYHLVRDRTFTGVGPVTEEWSYTRGWRVSWTFYGPSSTDRARMVNSALFMDYFNDQLSLANLYPVLDPPQPTRTPEQFNAQWWERSDFHVIMYEAVTESIQDQAVVSVELIVNANNVGQVVDITITK